MGIQFGSTGRAQRGFAVGIDLGTTNSLVAWLGEDGRPHVVDGAHGPLVPSVIAFDARGELRAVGVPADERVQLDPLHTIYSVKRLMGRSADEVAGELDLLPYVVHREEGSAAVRIEVGARRWTPPELSAFILRELKARASAALGQDVTQAVVTVPAYFNDAQRQATKDAGRLAGLDVLRIVNEPTAAALAYGLDRRPDGRIAVYDFGGGTFDISILHMHEGMCEVLATAGDTRLGGDDLDRAMVGAVFAQLQAAGIDLSGHPEALQRLRKAAIACKWALSAAQTATLRLELPEFGRPAVEIAWTRADFEALIGPIVARTLVPCRQALKDAGLRADQLDDVVLVGGSTRVPLVRAKVAELFGRAPHADIDPDLVVALGAAVQADILTSGRRDLLLLDVTPLSLGIETAGGGIAKLIHRNSAVPASQTEEFTTSVDLQTGVVVHVVQGERELAHDCRSLARLLLPIAPMPAGLPRVAVTFLIDANGILHVTARDLRTGKELALEVKPTYGLREDEMVRMLDDAFDHAEDDVARRLFADAAVDADNVVRATERAMQGPSAAQLDPDELDEIVGRVASVKAALATRQAEPVKAAVAALNHATFRLAEVEMARALDVAAHDQHVLGDLAQAIAPDPASVKPKHDRPHA
ncbi:MAG: Fe-S protein assembly chaperone HscA [Myxococcales bacterium]|nr:Fe-S protein assembly chaperone HscA [Myxococcales bacterium]